MQAPLDWLNIFMIFSTLISFLIALAILIAVHEYGHYQIARWCGVKVLRFSLGFGKVLWSKRFGVDQTEFTLCAIPLGGYVKMVDEHEIEVETGKPMFISPQDLPRAFNRQSIAKRMAIVVAGPFANFLLAIGLFAGLAWHGVAELPSIISAPPVSSAAAQAGLEAQDQIVAVNQTVVNSFSQLHSALLEHALGAPSVQLDITRNDNGHQHQPFKLTLLTSVLQNSAPEQDVLELLGIAPQAAAARVEALVPGGVAQVAGLQLGDRVVAIDEVPMRDAHHLVQTIRNSTDKNGARALKLRIARSSSEEGIQRGDSESSNVLPHQAVPGQMNEFNITLTPAIDASTGFAKIGVQLPSPPFVVVQYSPLEAIAQGCKRTWELSLFSLRMMGKLLTGSVSFKNISGPVTIADYAGKSARMGWLSFVSFLALISVSLGVMNLLPIPVLDGGHLLYYALEAVRGKPLSAQWMSLSQRLGFGILACLMALAFYNDFMRVFQ